MPDLENTFDSDDQLTNITVTISGAEIASLTEADFTESGSGPYTYTATYTAGTDGGYTFTLNTAEDAAGNNGASGQSDTITVGGGTTVDSFEDSDFSEYSGTGVADFSATSSVTPVDGSVVAETTQTNTDYASVSSTSGLGAYPAPDDTFRCYWQVSQTDCEPRFYWAVQSETEFPNGYRVQWNGTEAGLFVSGGSGNVDSATASISANTWYYWRVEWLSGGSITVELRQASDDSTLATLSTSDTTYTSGGINITTNSTGTDTTYYYDNIHIE